jgi:hypothetical protein
MLPPFKELHDVEDPALIIINENLRQNRALITLLLTQTQMLVQASQRLSEGEIQMQLRKVKISIFMNNSIYLYF